MLGRHGNRAPDPVVKVICPNRQVQTALYEAQNCGAGSMTREGLKQIWDLGRFTYRNYIRHGFLSGTYRRQDIYVQASASDRTLMSAAAWGDTAFPQMLVPNSPGSNVPVATYSVPMELDDLLEVRKARCLARLTSDVAAFDAAHGPAYLASPHFNSALDAVSRACGADLRNTSALTDGQFDVFDAVKDVSDAITGDFLEGFPRMQGLSEQDAHRFLQTAEALFQRRLYHSPAQPAYLSGKLPDKIVNVFLRHVADADREAAAAASVAGAVVAAEKEDLGAFAKVRRPRKLFSYHCHREVLYGIAKFLGVSVSVERPGLPDGLLHPAAGIFFELWEDKAKRQQQQQTQQQTQRGPQAGSVSRFSVRVLLWVPCWKGDGVTHTHHATGEELCPARLRTLPQCGSEEWCPLDKFIG